MYSDFYFRFDWAAKSARDSFRAAGGRLESYFKMAAMGGWFVVRVPSSYSALFERVAIGLFDYQVAVSN